MTTSTIGPACLNSAQAVARFRQGGDLSRVIVMGRLFVSIDDEQLTVPSIQLNDAEIGEDFQVFGTFRHEIPKLIVQGDAAFQRLKATGFMCKSLELAGSLDLSDAQISGSISIYGDIKGNLILRGVKAKRITFHGSIGGNLDVRDAEFRGPFEFGYMSTIAGSQHFEGMRFCTSANDQEDDS